MPVAGILDYFLDSQLGNLLNMLAT
jgi:hypothetical protein